MGTTVYSLQILGASLEDVRAALPRALVGRWSARFVTACPNLDFMSLESEAKRLSKKLSCTVLAVSMFDGDTLRLMLYRNGKCQAYHIAVPGWRGKAKALELFCSALGLSEELAPKLKRLFTACTMQEEKLAVMQALLGAPLFLRWDSEPPEEPVKADTGPLDGWLVEHPVPPKVKNQCKAELLQEIPDRHPEYGSNPLIFRPGVREGDGHTGWYSEDRARDVLGYARRGGEWARPLPDGHMELVPMDDATIKSDFDNISFASLGNRLIMMVSRLGPAPSGFPCAKRPFQNVVVRDTAGILPCPLALTWEGEPTAGRVDPLPDGGFLLGVPARYDGSRPSVKLTEDVLACYGSDGSLRWTYPGIRLCQATDCRIYAVGGERERMVSLYPDGTRAGTCSIPEGAHLHILDGTPYLIQNERRGSCLYRLTPDLQPDGETSVPYMSAPSLSPDGTLLYTAGFESGLRVFDARDLRILCDLPQKDGFCSPIVDGQNRLWVANRGCFECYTPSLECISRHRLKGSIYYVYRNAENQACALTFQNSKYILRVYRFS